MLILVLDSKLWLAGHMLSEGGLAREDIISFFLSFIFGPRLRRESARIAL
jgi:hypothetical protein